MKTQDKCCPCALKLTYRQLLGLRKAARNESYPETGMVMVALAAKGLVARNGCDAGKHGKWELTDRGVAALDHLGR